MQWHLNVIFLFFLCFPTLQQDFNFLDLNDTQRILRRKPQIQFIGSQFPWTPWQKKFITMVYYQALETIQKATSIISQQGHLAYTYRYFFDDGAILSNWETVKKNFEKMSEFSEKLNPIFFLDHPHIDPLTGLQTGDCDPSTLGYVYIRQHPTTIFFCPSSFLRLEPMRDSVLMTIIHELSHLAQITRDSVVPGTNTLDCYNFHVITQIWAKNPNIVSQQNIVNAETYALYCLAQDMDIMLQTFAGGSCYYSTSSTLLMCDPGTQNFVYSTKFQFTRTSPLWESNLLQGYLSTEIAGIRKYLLIRDLAEQKSEVVFVDQLDTKPFNFEYVGNGAWEINQLSDNGQDLRYLTYTPIKYQEKSQIIASRQKNRLEETFTLLINSDISMKRQMKILSGYGPPLYYTQNKFILDTSGTGSYIYIFGGDSKCLMFLDYGFNNVKIIHYNDEAWIRISTKAIANLNMFYSSIKSTQTRFWPIEPLKNFEYLIFNENRRLHVTPDEVVEYQYGFDEKDQGQATTWEFFDVSEKY